MTVKLSVIIFSAIALSLPVNAQQSIIDFGEINQSSKFFNEGNELVEQEIQRMQDGKLLKIKLPNGTSLSPNTDNYFLYTETNLMSVPEAAIDSAE